MHRFIPLFLFSLFISKFVFGQSDMASNFSQATDAFDHTRQEVMIPMRDGTKLYTVILIPKNLTGPAPIVLTRTPYSAKTRTTARPSPHLASVLRPVDRVFAESGYILAFQDVRGLHKSEGDYILNLPLRGKFNQSQFDHSTDTWDTIDWLIKNVKGHNGRVGITGTSYDGWTTLMGLFDPHPALKAAMPFNPMVDVWIGDDWFHNGAFRNYTLEYIYSQTSSKDADLNVPYGYNDLYDAYLKAGNISELAKRYNINKLSAWSRIEENPGYTSFWQDQAVDRLLKEKTSGAVPTLTVHGLFDQEDNYGSIAAYTALETFDKSNDKNFVVLGPWSHGQHGREGSALGSIRWMSDTAHYFRMQVMKPFFDKYLKDEASKTQLAPVLAFETGSNEWRSYDTWPPRPAKSRRIYLHGNGQLSFDVPKDEIQEFTQYISDPKKPVPYRVPPIRPIYSDDSTWRQWLVDDQRPFASRPDVITFESKPLEEPITISGEVFANLFASTTGTDADWVVKLIDVYPEEYAPQPELGGYQLMISADVMRGRYRENREQGAAIQPNLVSAYRVRMPVANHTFQQGHRIMIQIQSSWFPLYDRNPQTFVPNIFRAEPSAYKAATHQIYHSAGKESYIEFQVL
jgi:putative CocE/NonD family hydrolase